MATPFISDVRVGKPRKMGQENATDPLDRPWISGIVKESIKGPVWLGKTQLDGDGQADLKHHGGPDKAILIYAASHYPWWQKELNRSNFGPGAFGENLVVTGLTEEEVCIGDVYQVGETRIQISQPRQPCWKPARLWRIKDLALRMQNTGKTGWYARVLEEGKVEKGALLQRLERPYPRWTIAFCNEVMHRRQEDRKLAGELAACPVLAKSWVDTLSKRAESGENPDPKPRLAGPDQG